MCVSTRRPPCFSKMYPKSNCYRPQRSCGQGNVFTAVCDSVHRGGLQQGEPPGKENPPGRRTPWEGEPPRRRTHREGEAPQEGKPPPEEEPPGKQNPPKETPPRRPPRKENPPRKVNPPGRRTPPRHSVNERPVRILLECILVAKRNF